MIRRWGKPAIETVVARLGNMTVRIPAGWRSERTESGWWRCGDEDGEYTVFLDVEMSLPHESTGPDATPTEHALAYAREVEEGMPPDGYGIVEVSRLQSGRVVRGVRTFEHEGESFNEVQWFACTGFNGRVGIFRVHLITPLAVRDKSELKAIIALLEEQVRADSWSGTNITVNGAPLMRDFDMDGVVTLRLPIRLRQRRDNGMWFLSDPSGAPGRLWADYEMLEANRRAGRSPAQLAEVYARDWPGDGTRPISREITAAPLGAILNIVQDDTDEQEDEDDPPLRHVNWLSFAEAGSGRAVLAIFRLMIPRSRAEDSAMTSLQSLLDREIRALRVDEGTPARA